MSYDFKEGQSAVEYGESLLASREKSRKKASKRSRQIKRVNLALAAFKLGDMCLARRANRDVELMQEQKKFDLYHAKDSFNKLTKFESEHDAMRKLGVTDVNDLDQVKNYYERLAVDHLNKQKAILPSGAEWNKNQVKKLTEDFVNPRLKDYEGKLNRWGTQLGKDFESYSAPITSFYAEGIRNARDPKNTSLLRKIVGKMGLGKNKEIQEALTYSGKLPVEVSRLRAEQYSNFMLGATSKAEEYKTKQKQGDTSVETEDQEREGEQADIYNYSTRLGKLPKTIKEQLLDFTDSEIGSLSKETLTLEDDRLATIFDPNNEELMKRLEEANIDLDDNLFNSLYHINGGITRKGFFEPFSKGYNNPGEAGAENLFMSHWAEKAYRMWEQGRENTNEPQPVDWTDYYDMALPEVIKDRIIINKDKERLEILSDKQLKSRGIELLGATGERETTDEGDNDGNNTAYIKEIDDAGGPIQVLTDNYSNPAIINSRDRDAVLARQKDKLLELYPEQEREILETIAELNKEIPPLSLRTQMGDETYDKLLSEDATETIIPEQEETTEQRRAREKEERAAKYAESKARGAKRTEEVTSLLSRGVERVKEEFDPEVMARNVLERKYIAGKYTSSKRLEEAFKTLGIQGKPNKENALAYLESIKELQIAAR